MIIFSCSWKLFLFFERRGSRNWNQWFCPCFVWGVIGRISAVQWLFIRGVWRTFLRRSLLNKNFSIYWTSETEPIKWQLNATVVSARNGEEPIYTYQVNPNGTRRSLSIRTGSDSDSIICYRSREKKRIAAALLANSSILVIGEPGSGKSFLAQLITLQITEQGFLVSAPGSGTAKQTFMAIADDLGIDTETIEGKAMTTGDRRMVIV